MASSKNARYRIQNEDCDKKPAKRPRTRSQSLKITSLNDDCLIEIFSYLMKADMCSVKKTSPIFEYAVDRAFLKNSMDLVHLQVSR